MRMLAGYVKLQMTIRHMRLFRVKFYIGPHRCDASYIIVVLNMMNVEQTGDKGNVLKFSRHEIFQNVFYWFMFEWNLRFRHRRNSFIQQSPDDPHAYRCYEILRTAIDLFPPTAYSRPKAHQCDVHWLYSRSKIWNTIGLSLPLVNRVYILVDLIMTVQAEQVLQWAHYGCSRAVWSCIEAMVSRLGRFSQL